MNTLAMDNIENNIAKITIEKFQNKEQILYKLDKNKSLCEIIREVCAECDKPISTSYGLKLIISKKGSDSLFHYITEENLKEISQGDSLKLVYSISYLVDRTFSHMRDVYNERSFEDMIELCWDPAFIDEIVRKNNVEAVLDTFIDIDEPKATRACIHTILQLFSKGHIQSIDKNFLDKLINIIQTREHSTHVQQYALSLVHKILTNKNKVFLDWKMQIVRKISIGQLMQFVYNDSTDDLKYGAILLINTIIKSCKNDEKKLECIKTLNQKAHRSYIYKEIIEAKRTNIEDRLQHELYVAQCFILSLYKESLQCMINLDESELIKKDEFKIIEPRKRLNSEIIARNMSLIDFDEDISIAPDEDEQIVWSQIRNDRYSVASILSEDPSEGYGVGSHSRSQSICESDNRQMSLLTLDALRYYKKAHLNNFLHSQLEENAFEIGIEVTSERVTQILAKILHIGRTPVKKSKFYQPIVFLCSSRKPFFYELFSRAMWLLSRTRLETKVSTLDDYPKLMKILEKQILMVLEQKPLNFKILTQSMTEISFKSVLKSCTEEHKKALDDLIANHPSIQELKANFAEENKELMLEQRVKFLLDGAYFPKILEKEKKLLGRMFVRLSDNRRQLLVTEDKTIPPLSYEIEDITHVVLGKNCAHHTLTDNPALVFSVIFNNEKHVKFIAEDERMATYWSDAFLLIKGNSWFLSRQSKSDLYVKDLNKMVDMDIRLKLMELQNVILPLKPPPIPPYPPSCRPIVPPKPKPEQKQLLNRKSSKSLVVNKI